MSENRFDLSYYRYELPERAIAQEPCRRRDHARLLLVDRGSGDFREAPFSDFPVLAGPGELVVFNDTRVVPARLAARKESGGRLELLLIARRGPRLALALTRGRARAGMELGPADGARNASPFRARLLGKEPSGAWLVEFSGEVEAILERHGEIPLPPYIRRSAGESDLADYQTVYARCAGAVAAPTAGLHFTREVLDQMELRGIEKAFLTLHVGWGTFRPVRCPDIRAHRMEEEWFEVPPATVEAFARVRGAGKAVTAVGTTVVRTLETVWRDGGLEAGSGESGIYIYPGYRFRAVDRMLTNFHLPETTTLLMTAAFCGWEILREAYRFALERGFRFGSYGDCMYIR